MHRELSIEISPANVLGIELNPYAAELARVTVWIGEIQWMLSHGYQYRIDPILAPLNHIECRDAILNQNYTEAEWPSCDVIVGNPPFLGGAKKRRELGIDYFKGLSNVYKRRVANGSDLVCYWFDKAFNQINSCKAKFAGLVATNSIRQKSNRLVLENIVKNNKIFEAWSDEEWINAGASVRVSLICFGSISTTRLDGQEVYKIHSDLHAGEDITQAKPIVENASKSFFGLALAGKFTINQSTAEEWLKLPNPNNQPNSNVIRPLWNGLDLTGRWNGRWVIDFALMNQNEAMLYETPFTYVERYVKPVRDLNNRRSRAEKWWRHGEARPAMRNALATINRYIVTSEKSKHRFFVWLSSSIAPDNRLIVIARSDEATFGVLSSRIHVVWALRLGSTLEDRPAYATTTCFETFPFPETINPHNETTNNQIVDSISVAAIQLNQLRENWLNPPEWVDWVITPEELNAGYPQRAKAKTGYETKLKKRTLTNLYNQNPAWLTDAHKTLDLAVARAYGWHDYTSEMPEKEILSRLLALNIELTRS